MKFPLMVWRRLLLSIALFTSAIGATPVNPQTIWTQANVMVEMTFTAARTYEDPFNDVTLDAVFVDPLGRELRVPAFWAGENRWKVRYASPQVGAHRFTSVASDASDAGLSGVSGVVEVKPYTGSNPLYRHGPLKVSANKRYLEYHDGKPFFWLGDTWWMGLCSRLTFPEDVMTLAADRKKKGFNVIQIVAGLYPDMMPFDPRGANEGGFPWEPEYARMRPAYFDAADQRLQYLVEEGFTPCIVGIWGYFLPMMGVEKAKNHWRYLVARYGALPVVWCIAGEANLPWYQAKGFPFDDRAQAKGWTEVTRYVRGLDPFHRLITVHPTGIGRLSARNAIEDTSLLDFDLLQTPHGQRSAVAPTVRTMRESYADSPVLPIINGEPAYEMLNDKLPTEWSRQMFWLCMMNGAMGHTYGANGIWQVNRRGKPHGPSPWQGSPSTGYGIIAWNDAMNLPGSQQVAYGRKLFEAYRWQDFEPHPEWAQFTDRTPFEFKAASWIAFPEGRPGGDAPEGKRWFRQSFDLPTDREVKRAQLFIAADGSFNARLNKRTAGTGNGAASVSTFYDLSGLLVSGKNAFAISTDNSAAHGKNPAGLIARLDVTFADGGAMSVLTDGTWHSTRNEAKDWDTADFIDTDWARATVMAAYGDGPWGKLALPNNNDIYGPQSTGIADGVRLIYVPQSAAIEVRHLERNGRYNAATFDPVTGVKSPWERRRSDGNGSVAVAPPQGIDHDWVLVLEPIR